MEKNSRKYEIAFWGWMVLVSGAAIGILTKMFHLPVIETAKYFATAGLILWMPAIFVMDYFVAAQELFQKKAAILLGSGFFISVFFLMLGKWTPVYFFWITGSLIIAVLVEPAVGLMFHLAFCCIAAGIYQYSTESFLFYFIIGGLACVLIVSAGTGKNLLYVEMILLSCQVVFMFVKDSFTLAFESWREILGGMATLAVSVLLASLLPKKVHPVDLNFIYRRHSLDGPEAYGTASAYVKTEEPKEPAAVMAGTQEASGKPKSIILRKRSGGKGLESAEAAKARLTAKKQKKRFEDAQAAGELEKESGQKTAEAPRETKKIPKKESKGKDKLFGEDDFASEQELGAIFQDLMKNVEKLETDEDAEIDFSDHGMGENLDDFLRSIKGDAAKETKEAAPDPDFGEINFNRQGNGLPKPVSSPDGGVGYPEGGIKAGGEGQADEGDAAKAAKESLREESVAAKAAEEGAKEEDAAAEPAWERQEKESFAAKEADNEAEEDATAGPVWERQEYEGRDAIAGVENSAEEAADFMAETDIPMEEPVDAMEAEELLSAPEASDPRKQRSEMDEREMPELPKANGAYETYVEPSMPLLKRLKEELPQTYKHCLLVSLLSEKAAALLGADASLCKAGAMYHEIGKLSEMKEYKEAGVRMLQWEEYPEEITRIVEEHSGKEKTPTTKESAIVMLTDNVVTTIRYFDRKKGDKKPSRRKIIDNIFVVRMEQGYLDEAGFNLGEYKTLKDFFEANIPK